MERSQGDDGKQQTKHSLPHSANSVDTANELNTFHARFDVRDFSEDCATLCETIVPEQLDLSETDVVTRFSRLNSHKPLAQMDRKVGL